MIFLTFPLATRNGNLLPEMASYTKIYAGRDTKFGIQNWHPLTLPPLSEKEKKQNLSVLLKGRQNLSVLLDLGVNSLLNKSIS
jgi:hypothetical protein